VDNIKTDFREVVCDVTDWIDWLRTGTNVNRIPEIVGKSLSSCTTGGWLRRAQLQAVSRFNHSSAGWELKPPNLKDRENRYRSSRSQCQGWINLGPPSVRGSIEQWWSEDYHGKPEEARRRIDSTAILMSCQRGLKPGLCGQRRASNGFRKVTGVSLYLVLLVRSLQRLRLRKTLFLQTQRQFLCVWQTWFHW
jgi:hypothetical protein